MDSLSSNDSAILTRVLQYRRVPMDERLALLRTASPKAQEVGRFLLDPQNSSPASPDVAVAAASFQRWLESNRRVGRLRATIRHRESYEL